MHDLDNVNYDLWIDGNATCGWDPKCTRVYKNDKRIIGLFPGASSQDMFQLWNFIAKSFSK